MQTFIFPVSYSRLDQNSRLVGFGQVEPDLLISAAKILQWLVTVAQVRLTSVTVLRRKNTFPN
jgi:hypothetical protein